MKHIFILFTLFSLTIFGCSEAESPAIEPTSQDSTTESSSVEPPDFELMATSKPVLFDYTSTGCPGCGSWGKPTFESLIRQHDSTIVPIAVHIKYRDAMITPVSEAIAANRTGQYFTPQLWVNNTNGVVLNGGRIDATASLNLLNSTIENVRNKAADISVGLSIGISNDTLKVRYKTLPNIDLSASEVYVGIYLMENKLRFNQSGSASNPTIHNHVIRASNNGGFGTQLASNDLTINELTENTYSFKLNEAWNKDELYAAIIVWKKEGNNYVVLNANNGMTKN